MIKKRESSFCPPLGDNSWPKCHSLLLCLNLFLLFIFLVHPAKATTAQAKATDLPSKTVLILHSYHKGFRWTDNVMLGIESVLLSQSQVKLEILTDYMDTKRINLDKISPSLVDLFKLKYGNDQPDIILSSDDNALNFLLQRRDVLFPGVPIVFCGVNNFKMERLGGQKGITGVVEDYDIEKTVELIFDLHPHSQHLALITDSTPTGKINRQRFLDSSSLPTGIELIDLNDLSTSDLIRELKALPDDTIILNLSFFRDRDGKAYTTVDGNQLISQTSGKPIYSCWDFYLRGSVVGGKVVSGFSQGQEAAAMALEILSGKPVNDVNILFQSPNEYMFDYGPLMDAGLSLNALPPESVVLNQPHSFYDNYKTELVAALIAFIILCTLLVVMGLNIMQRRSIQKQLSETLDEFQSIFDNSQVGILMLRCGRTVYQANQRLADMFGYLSPDELVGQSVRVFHVTDDNFVEFGSRFFDTLSTGKNVHVEYELKRKDGSSFWSLISGKAVDTNFPPDLTKGVVWVLDDISERKQFESKLERVNSELEERVHLRTIELEKQAEQLQSANNRLQKLDKLKSAFLSTVSHDLRTPMTSIRGFAKLIKKDFEKAVCTEISDQSINSKLQDRILSNLNIIDQEGERLTRLINDVLDLSRIETGRQSWNDQPLKIEECVQGAVDSLKGELAAHSKVELQVLFSDELPTIVADQDRLHQVLFNLLSNALKYTDEGVIAVKVDKNDSDSVLFSVSDEGCGIPADEIDLVFDKFHQVETGDTLKNTLKGSGLGLAICKEIVRHYGGDITAQSEPGKGSVFTFSIPV